MKNKYYTPEIEEFHYGFEYEMIPSTGLIIFDFSDPYSETETLWSTEYRKGKFGINSINILGGGFADIKAAIKDDKCRVKYLDRQDLEELGFTQTDPDFFEFDKKGDKKIVEYCLTLDYFQVEKGWYLAITEDENQFNFSGWIKNKSELIKVLKQTNML